MSRSLTWTWRVTTAKLSVALLGLCVPFVLPAAIADPTEESRAAWQSDADYAIGKAAIDLKDWNTAIRALSAVAAREPQNADIQNYLGYAHRHAGRLDVAFKHYERALQLNPQHRGAHEYVGEAYLLVDNLTKAEEHLAALQRICRAPCDEHEDLRKAIADYRRRVGK